jgi:hypothetical protein
VITIRSKRERARHHWLAAGVVVALPVSGLVLLAASESNARTTAATPAAVTRPDGPRPAPGARSAPSARPEAPAAPPRTAPASSVAPASVTEERELYLEALANPARLARRDVKEQLLATAADPRATVQARGVALDLLRRAPELDAAAVARIGAIAVAPVLDEDTRLRAIDALHELGDRPELESALRAALLAAAAAAGSPDGRALALESVATNAATPDEVARVAGYLADPSARVRASAARALAGTSVRDRDLVVASVEQAFSVESDVGASLALVDAALLAGRSGAEALLGRMAGGTLVARTPELAREIADYRSSLQSGETDAKRIQKDHQAREDARAAQAR